jgi:hypothetical protein
MALLPSTTYNLVAFYTLQGKENPTRKREPYKEKRTLQGKENPTRKREPYKEKRTLQGKENHTRKREPYKEKRRDMRDTETQERGKEPLWYKSK